MNTILILVIAIFPPLMVAATALVVVKRFIENDQRKKLIEMKYQSKNVITPIRLQAYERMAMFLERIEPNSLLFRVNNPELTAYQMQTILLATIRSEYEHNLSQQVYISPEVWDAIKNAKERVVNVINVSAGQLAATAMATDLATQVFQMVAEESPIAVAMLELKKEIAVLY
ncbi:MAG: hypothetical protein IJT04_01220 [Bacteroidales bacterium]|nr:hypothetical protein [Bacteroidales bacterium]